MKNLLTLLLIWVLTACSTGSKENIDQDSVTAAYDTTAVGSVNVETNDEDAEEESSEEPSDTSQLEITFDETAGLVFDRNELFYTVSITTSQYEGSSNVTWYFDTDISPIYFKETWSMEGNEGSTEFFISGGEVDCAYVDESNELKKWCRTTGGISTSYDEGGSATKAFIPFEYGTDCNAELSRYLGILKSILDQADQTAEDENSYSFIIAKTTEIGGQEVNESTEITIPKKVYERIRN